MQRSRIGKAALFVGLCLVWGMSAQAQTYSRTEVISYHDNTTKWVLGQVAQVKCVAPTAPLPAGCGSSGTVMSESTFDSATALPLTFLSFGKLQQTLTYNTNGTVATAKDGNNNLTAFNDWKRGIPQTITFADSFVKSAAVDDFGQITSVTNEVGAKTCYGYDAMGRVSSITLPSEVLAGACNQDNWLATTITFAPSAASKYGLPANHWRRTEATGNARKVTFYDAMWRPVVQEVYDATDTGNTLSQTVTRYDSDGRAILTSYPQRNFNDAVYNTWANPAVVANLTGSTQEYDALGRPTIARWNSELGVLLSTTQYLAGSTILVTNARGQQTTTSYMAYDQPSTDFPVAISHPEGAYTTVFRDVFGKPTTLVRSNADNSEWSGRYYAYDEHQRLCKQSELETATTAYGYDNAGNVTWSATALPWSPNAPCGYAAGDASVAPKRVDRAYDVRNRLQTLAFPDGRGNQTWLYTADGFPATITTYNDVASGGQVVNQHTYNKRRLLTGESQSQPGMPVWALGYGYSVYGTLASTSYPDGLSIAYVPNALGQPTQAGSYATGVNYFANGAMQQFTYGNGIVHKLTQNDRQLPDTSCDYIGTCGPNATLNDGYDYDANGNVASISDGRTGGRGNRTMFYDGLDRLKTATSPMFPGGTAYEYDKLDNLTRVTAPGRDHYYCYDAHKWLTNVKTGSCSGTSVIGLGYDDRGNLANKNGVQYQFDYGNRLRDVPGKESYRYDGYGRRVSAQAIQGTIYSFYGQDGVLRYQHDERKAEAYDYISLNGSLVARVTDPNSVLGVPTLSAPSSSSNGAYTVQWTAIASATRYEVEEAFNGGAWVGAYTGTSLNLALSGKASGSYAYRARACKNTPCSGWSATATVLVNQVPAAAPSIGVPAIATNGNYSVDWTAVSGANSYTLEESANGGAWTGAYTGANLSQAYASRSAGSYAYRVKACNLNGCSGVSNTATTQAVYIPGTPTLSLPASSYDGNYTVSWNAVSAATSYQLEESVNGGAWNLVQSTAATSKAYSGKADGSYTYRAKACNAAGCSGVSISVGIAVLTPPTAVSTVTAPANNYTGSYPVNWTTVPKATSYTLHVKVNGAVNGTNIYSGTGTSYNISGQGQGSYAYYVLACNGAGCSNWSSPATTQVALVSIPATPVLSGYNEDILPKTFPVTFDIYLNWSGSAGATSYELKKNVGANSTTIYSGTNLNYHLVGQVNWTFQVRACNAAGCSAWSSAYVL